jgi:hypothetical protein
MERKVRKKVLCKRTLSKKEKESDENVSIIGGKIRDTTEKTKTDKYKLKVSNTY